jgi:hypothetical protein
MHVGPHYIGSPTVGPPPVSPQMCRCANLQAQWIGDRHIEVWVGCGPGPSAFLGWAGLGVRTFYKLG